MVAVGLAPKSPYPGAMEPWPSDCLVCGREVSPTLHNIRAGQSGCRFCVNRSVDPAVALAVMKRAGATPKVAFPGSDAHWPCTCDECGRDIAPRYSSIKARQKPCKFCSGRAVDHAAAVAVMNRAALDVLGSWPGSDKPWRCRCTRCGDEVFPAYNNVRRGHAGCLRCSGHIVDPEAAAKIMRSAGLAPVGEYPGSDVPWECLCLTCGGTVYPRYSGIRQGQGGCRRCAKYGLDLAAPALVYLVWSRRWMALKVGVTNQGSRRLTEHQRHGWTVWRAHGSVCIWSVDTGRQAMTAEKAVLEHWRQILHAPPALAAADMPQSGASETALLVHVDPDDAAAFIARAVAGS